jgi:hypothetical protein
MSIAIEFIALLLLLIVAIVLIKPLLHHSDNKHLLIAYASVIAIHSSVSIWNGLYGPVYGADNDALRFHEAALNYFDPNSDVDLLVPGWIYSIFLAFVYELTEYSWAIGSMLSTIFFAGVIIISINLYRLLTANCSNLQINNYLTEVKIIVLLGLIPASIILTSITMREVYQMFFICAAVLYTVKFIRNSRLLDLVLMATTLFLFTGLHTSFRYYVAIYVFALLCFILRGIVTPLKWKYKLVLLATICLLVLFSDVSVFHATIYKFVEGTAGAEDSRAYYGLPDISANLFSILGFMCISLLNYMVRPFPWEMTSVIDVLPFFENMLRLFFIWRIFQLRRYVTASMAWVLFAALLLELLWGMGTLNWGTAQRHHLVVWPLFVVIYYAVVSRFNFIKSTNNLTQLPQYTAAV